MAIDIVKLRTLQPPDGLGFKIRRLGGQETGIQK